MRGVHSLALLAAAVALGSSPHARGPPGYLAAAATMFRIIPACAGSTYVLGAFEQLDEDHPRMRGVHQILLVPVRIDVGSSPHARGPHTAAGNRTPPSGIIPACAGST